MKNNFFLLKVYSNIKESVYVDLVYDITYNTLFTSEQMVCDNRMDNLFDVTLYHRISEDLEKHFNCTVPFLPPIQSKLTGHTTDICKEVNKSIAAIERYDYLYRRA